MAVIETAGLAKSFEGRGGAVRAVRSVDLAVGEGEIFGFLGPNGAGKTTTLRMLATLLEPSGGEARVVGHDLLGEPARVRERIGYVSQAGGADENATGRENLVLQGRLHGMAKKEARGRSEELAETLELSAFADRGVKTYSGGQRRRLDLALGMIHRPVLLFLDEPTTGLDPQSRARLWEEVRRLRDGGTTVFVTTHYMDEADALCDRLAIIDHGELVAEGTPGALKRRISGDVVEVDLDAGDDALERALELFADRPFVREVDAEGTLLRLYVDGGEKALPGILRGLDAAGLGVAGISLSRPTLDDVFLRQTGRSLREADGGSAAAEQPAQPEEVRQR